MQSSSKKSIAKESRKMRTRGLVMKSVLGVSVRSNDQSQARKRLDDIWATNWDIRNLLYYEIQLLSTLIVYRKNEVSLLLFHHTKPVLMESLTKWERYVCTL